MKSLLLTLLAFFVLLACQNKTAEEELKKLKAQVQLYEQNKSIVREYWEGKWNQRRPEILDELQSQNVIYHGTSGEMHGIKEYKQAYISYLAAIHNSHVDINELIAEGNLVMSSTVISGINDGELNGLPPTGKNVSVSLFTIFRIEEGKIAEEWEIMDDLGFMMQLGFTLQMKK